MRKSNINKIEKAIGFLKNQTFSIADICKHSNVSDPTVRNYLKTTNPLKLTEVSYGKYEIADSSTDTPKPINLAQNLNNSKHPKVQTEPKHNNNDNIKTPILMKQTTKPAQPTSQPNSDAPIQIHGELYLNAYLKGFDRGFELGLKKASELASPDQTFQKTKN